ncbi:hypothetical protein C3941_00290 [Kaistia algarum]|uniref:SEL1-like repeat protein n=1 Tax=Kaistia algarum TaxID=2083279 RepID=UPI000CE89396|nr:SEL1-like repeat protein [Kaistia algarum]MCX5513344.1 SEL1-like repeat protein [Kaistia algarum]PPE81205.1 hypothetical protein C3941_00290 [Kaistia algarum]
MRSGSRSGYEVSESGSAQPPRPKGSLRSGDEASAARIAALSALVDELSGQIDAIEGSSRREAIRRGVRQAAAQPEPRPVRSEPSRPDPQTERLGAIESRLAAIAAQIAKREAPAQASPTPRREEIGPLQSAIAEISARQQTIDRVSGPKLPAVDTIALEDALQALREEIVALDRRIVSEVRRGEEFGRSLRSELVERASPPASSATEAALAGLRSDLAGIRQGLELAARETTLASVESGYGHMIERLDDIVRRVPERERLDTISREIARLADRVEQAPRPREIDGELEDIRNAIASIATRRPDDTLSVQIAELRQAVERIGETAGRTGDVSRIEDRLDAIAGRLDGSGERRLADLATAIEKLAARPRENVDLSHIERDIGAMRREIDGFAKGTDPVVLIRLEQQVAAIRSALEEKLPVQGDLHSAALLRLEERLDALAGRFDAIADLPNLIAPASGEALAGLRSEIADLRSDVVQRQPARFDEIEDQMRHLVRRLDDAASREDGPGLASLEAQVGALAEKLAFAEPGADALSKVEANLDRLQQLLADARHETIETARVTARTTLEEFAGSLASGHDDEMVRALREDLRRLQDAALHSDRQNQDTLEAVHDTLAKVVDRIAQLEAEDSGHAATYSSIKERARSAVPARPMAGDLPEDHRPLAPGSGKPDVAGVSIRPEGDVAVRAGDRKADFIAAARRAAQAAQVETAKARAEEREASEADEKPGPFARIGQALRSRRRPLVLAIAAVVLAIGAAKLGPPLQDRIVEALAPAVAIDRTSDLDPTATGSVAKPVRNAAANPAPAPVAPKPAIVAASPMVAPKPNSEAIAFSQDPFSGYLSAAAVPPTPEIEKSTASSLDYALVQAAATKGDPIAAFVMARHLAEPAIGKPDIKLAAEWYERSAKAGFALAQYRVGSLYERGDGVKLDVALAQRWYEKASLQGNARATHNLAVLISEGANGQPDYKRAASLFEVAAAYGVADSQYNLGVLYARGLGVPVNMVQSYKWFALAALQGDTDSGQRRDEVAKAMKPGDLATARIAVQGFQPTPVDPVANNEPAPDPAWFAAPAATSMTDRATSKAGSAT